MRVKTIIDEDFTNYKKPCMFIGTISCGGKCCTDAGIPLCTCQNDSWRKEDIITIDDRELCVRYLNNFLTSSIVFGGLEPFEQYDEMVSVIWNLRTIYACDDDIVIYTGYNRDEIKDKVVDLEQYKNIIIKFGRYVPNQKPHYDGVLGVHLASDNQYGERIS